MWKYRLEWREVDKHIAEARYVNKPSEKYEVIKTYKHSKPYKTKLEALEAIKLLKRKKTPKKAPFPERNWDGSNYLETWRWIDPDSIELFEIVKTKVEV